MIHRVTKTYGHELGLSCVFRQHRADSHCRHLHGYALRFDVTFEADRLDANGWVVDFGGLGWLRDRLKRAYDHRMLVAADDDKLVPVASAMHEAGLASVYIVPATGCEAFASNVHRWVSEWIADHPDAVIRERVRLVSVACSEHGANRAVALT